MSSESDSAEEVSAIHLLDLRTGESEELATFQDFYIWSAAADLTWEAVLVGGFDLAGQRLARFYRLRVPRAVDTGEGAVVVLEAEGTRQPYAGVVFDAGEEVFYLAMEAVGTGAEGEKYRDTVLYRYEPYVPPVELTRFGRTVFLEGEVDEGKIFVTYDGETPYGVSRVYGYIDKGTYDIVPLGIYPAYLGREPRRYVPYGGMEVGVGQYTPSVPTAIAGPRAYVSEEVSSTEPTARTMYLRESGAPGGYREVEAAGSSESVLYSQNRQAFIYLTAPVENGDRWMINVIYADGTLGDPVPLPPGEATYELLRVE
ncbi:MAG: hypothetical protein JSU81_02385 [Candidatus Coatesbacteria bacterium]|nr:MAG: hypothetical protein JSU81_02385 [Candidatus Coatesbacteria bacterium]